MRGYAGVFRPEMLSSGDVDERAVRYESFVLLPSEEMMEFRYVDYASS